MRSQPLRASRPSLLYGIPTSRHKPFSDRRQLARPPSPLGDGILRSASALNRPSFPGGSNP
jgi:hypothetical protein